METLEQIPWKSQDELFEKLEEMSKLAAWSEFGIEQSFHWFMNAIKSGDK